jgi:hypothetical protein
MAGYLSDLIPGHLFHNCTYPTKIDKKFFAVIQDLLALASQLVIGPAKGQTILDLALVTFWGLACLSKVKTAKIAKPSSCSVVLVMDANFSMTGRIIEDGA